MHLFTYFDFMSKHPCEPFSCDYDTLGREIGRLGMIDAMTIHCGPLEERGDTLRITVTDEKDPGKNLIFVRIILTELGVFLTSGRGVPLRKLTEGDYFGIPNDEEPLLMIRMDNELLDIKKQACVDLKVDGLNELLTSSLPPEREPVRHAIARLLEGQDGAAFAAGRAATARTRLEQLVYEAKRESEEKEREATRKRNEQERVDAALTAILNGEPMLFHNVNFEGTLRTPIFGLLTSPEDGEALRILDLPMYGATFAVINDTLILFEKPWSHYDTNFKKCVRVAPDTSFHVSPNLDCHFDGEILEIKHVKNRPMRVDIAFTSCFQAEVLRERVRKSDFTSVTKEPTHSEGPITFGSLMAMTWDYFASEGLPTFLDKINSAFETALELSLGAEPGTINKRKRGK